MLWSKIENACGKSEKIRIGGLSLSRSFAIMPVISNDVFYVEYELQNPCWLYRIYQLCLYIHHIWYSHRPYYNEHEPYWLWALSQFLTIPLTFGAMEYPRILVAVRTLSIMMFYVHFVWSSRNFMNMQWLLLRSRFVTTLKPTLFHGSSLNSIWALTLVGTYTVLIMASLCSV